MLESTCLKQFKLKWFDLYIMGSKVAELKGVYYNLIENPTVMNKILFVI